MSNKKTTKASAQQEFDRDLLNYSVDAQMRSGKKNSWAAYGAASSVALLACSGVDATIIYSGAQNISLNAFSQVALDIDGGGNDLVFDAFATGTVWEVFGTAFYTGGAQIQTDGAGDVAALSFGQSVGTAGSSLGFAANGVFSQGYNFLASSPAFMGIQLGSGNFAWIQVHNLPNGADFEIIDWAYDDSGAHIMAGSTTSVPEPRTMLLVGMGLLAMGASGLRTMRRRKREAGLTNEAAAAA